MQVLVVGEALVDVFYGPSGTSRRAGGSCANVAVGLARLGISTTLLTTYARDADGELLDAFLQDVDVIRLDGPTSTATALIGPDGSATYDFDVTWALASTDTPIPPSTHVHVGSLGAVLQPGADTVLDVVRKHRGTISYDPNWRPGLMDAKLRSRAEQLVQHADVVKLSDEDARAMYSDEEPEGVTEAWLRMGPQLVLLTRGADGADAWTADGHRRVTPRPSTAVVDTVGAGDAFMAAALWAWLEGFDTERTLELATTAAGLTCERPGADPPTRAALLST